MSTSINHKVYGLVDASFRDYYYCEMAQPIYDKVNSLTPRLLNISRLFYRGVGTRGIF